MLLPIFIMAVFFLTSQFILLDDHEIYRMHFGELNIFSAIEDDWQNMRRFRPVYWFVRQMQSLFFGIHPMLWYGSSLLLLALSMVVFYLFLRNIKLSKFTSVLFSWTAFLGYRSINSWLALGPQEGMALCFFSCSLFFLSRYTFSDKEKQFKWSVLFFILAALSKETFPLLSPFLVAVLLLHDSIVKDKMKKIAIFIAIPVFLLLIFAIQSISDNNWLTDGSFSPKFSYLSIFINQLKVESHILFSFILFAILSIFISFKRKNADRYLTSVIILLCLLGNVAQLLIYSCVESSSPHYVQPISFAIILSLSMVLYFYPKRAQLIISGLLLFIVPSLIYRTLLLANEHNFNSRIIHEVELIVGESDKKTVVIVGHRSYDHEKIYSLFKRFEYLYPNKKVYFYHFNNGYPDEGTFDVSEIIPELADISLLSEPIVVSFSEDFLLDNGFLVGELQTQPLTKYLDSASTWYTSVPYYSFNRSNVKTL